MENNSILNQEDQEQIELPPGFRFHPTDEELIVHYLSPKVLGNNFSAKAIGEVDLNKCEPWELPGRAKMGEKEWYFFCVRDRKYPTGLRTNRATEAGYWKATGKDKEIFKGRKTLIGMKKTLVFYKGRAPKGEKSNWVMHEFRLDGKFSVYYNLPKTSKKEWVICRVFKKKSEVVYEPSPSNSVLPPLMESSSPAEEIKPHSHVTCFSNSMEEQDNYIFSNKQNPLFYNTQINVNDLSLHFQQQEEDQNIILRMILENEEEAAASIQEEDDPSTSAAGPVDDLDCLWNYRY